MSFFSRTLALTALLAANLSSPAWAQPADRPNILVIVADDLGYSDIGAFGGEIDTPNLDALARKGVRLTGFHTAPTCSPTRAMLLTGTDNHVAGLGTMAELIAPNQAGQPGHEGYLRRDVATLAERLLAGGYRTILSGKWHLGLARDQDPHARGFQRSFALLQGGHNHFGLGTSTDPAKGSTYTRDGVPVAALPADFYSTDYFATQLVEQLQASRSNGGADKPFFAYLAFTAPHWPLQAPAEDIAKYRGRYDAGFDVLRAQRLKRQEELGLIAPGTVAHSQRLPQGGWDALTAAEKRQSSRDMEIYAAMVDRLDRNVGRVLDALRQSGELDNTVILFLADNGAEGLDAETTGARMLERYVKAADNSFDNRGSATSYVTYGPGWAQAATAPSWITKGYATEGGTRAIAFINGPGLARPDGISRAFLHVTDVTPTLLHIAGLDQGTAPGPQSPLKPVTGRSWLPYLTGAASDVHGTDNPVGTELFGSRALRRGDWKVTDIGDGKWRLFNIARDPGETNDLALAEPERLASLIADWEDYARRTGVILSNVAPYRP